MEEKTKIQTLYDACNAVFCAHKEELPSYEQIIYLEDLLNSIKAADVGIDEFGNGGGLPSSSTGSCKDGELIRGQDIDKITYVHIYECENFSIGLFCFPAGGTFPLHDHPGMTVLSKLLYGSMYVRAYDWVRKTSSHQTAGFAGKVMDEVMEAPCEPLVLFPKSWNIHTFTALTPCAILEVEAPPYSEERLSTCYLDHPIPRSYFIDRIPVLGYAMLEERDLSEDLAIARTPYLGPPIVTKDEPCLPG